MQKEEVKYRVEQFADKTFREGQFIVSKVVISSASKDYIIRENAEVLIYKDKVAIREFKNNKEFRNIYIEHKDFKNIDRWDFESIQQGENYSLF